MIATTIRPFLVLWCAMLPAQAPPTPTPAGGAEEPRFTAPLADDDSKLAPLLARAREAAKSADGGALLASAEFAPLRELTPFRDLVRDHAPRGEVCVCLPDEPGQRLVVTGSVKDGQGKPVADALVYAYHTSAKGWYSDRAPHFSGNSGDVRHARLFCYVRTDEQGRFVLHTIRPGGYPRSTLPEHIHLHIDVGGKPVLGTEVVFDDDARLTKELRERAQHGEYVIVKPTKGAGGGQEAAAEFAVDVPPRADRPPR